MTSLARAEATLLRYALDRPVGGSAVAQVDVVLVDVEDSDGARGLGFTYVLGGGGDVVLAASQAQLALVRSTPVAPPQASWRRVAATFGRTGLGPNLVALAALDVALWDLEAKRRGVPLSTAFGGTSRAVPVYGSGGFTAAQSAAEAAEVAAQHVARGHRAVKPRMAGTRRDVAVLDATCRAVPPHVHVMADANERCDLASARWLLSAARDHGVLFVEEPLPSASIDGYRALALSGGAPVATGEHLQGTAAFLPYCAERLAVVLQPDLAMAGGLTPILQLGAICDAFGVSLSPHFLPGLFVHVAAACPAVTWLEDFPLLEPLFDGWPALRADGTMAPTAKAGHGLSVDAGTRARFAL